MDCWWERIPVPPLFLCSCHGIYQTLAGCWPERWGQFNHRLKQLLLPGTVLSINGCFMRAPEGGAELQAVTISPSTYSWNGVAVTPRPATVSKICWKCKCLEKSYEKRWESWGVREEKQESDLCITEPSPTALLRFINRLVISSGKCVVSLIQMWLIRKQDSRPDPDAAVKRLFHLLWAEVLHLSKQL